MASMRSWLSLVITSHGAVPSLHRRHGGDIDVHVDAAGPAVSLAP